MFQGDRLLNYLHSNASDRWAVMKLSDFRSSEAVENAKKGNTDESDEKLACFTSCMLKKIGIVSNRIVRVEYYVQSGGK